MTIACVNAFCFLLSLFLAMYNVLVLACLSRIQIFALKASVCMCTKARANTIILCMRKNQSTVASLFIHAFQCLTLANFRLSFQNSELFCEILISHEKENERNNLKINNRIEEHRDN